MQVLTEVVPGWVPALASGILGVLLSVVVLRGVHAWRSRRQLQELVAASANSVLLLNDCGAIVLVNEQVEQDFGYPQAELLGQSIGKLFPDLTLTRCGQPPDSADPVLMPWPLKTDGELLGRHQSGRPVPVRLVLTRLQDRRGPALLVNAINISERRLLERELDQQRAELAHLSQRSTMSELSGSLAHELNQPLTAILGNAQAALSLLEQAQPNRAELRAILADIVSDNKRASDVIRGLRALFGKGELQRESVDINALVAQTLRLLTDDLLKRGIQCRTRLAPGLIQVNAVQTQIQQVLINLIMNACEAMQAAAAEHRPDASPATLLVTSSRQGASVQVCISDQGTGLAEHQLEQVFAPFYSTKPQGLGLGLAVCRKIVKAHGGALWAANNPDRGASFYLTLPVVSEEVQHERRA